MKLIRASEEDVARSVCKGCGYGFETNEGMLLFEPDSFPGRRITYHWRRPDCSINEVEFLAPIQADLDAQAKALGLSS